MKKIKLSMISQIMIAVVFGVLFGLILGDFSKSLKIVGDIFLRLIQMSIPLLVSGQIIEAVASLNPREVGAIGKKTIIIFASSSLLAAMWGIVMALIFKPGSGVDIQGLSETASMQAQNLSLHDTLLNFIPTNFISALAEGSIPQIIVFSLFFGVVLSVYRVDHQGSKFYDVLVEFNSLIIKLVTLVMKIAPVGIFALIASIIGQLGVSVILPLVKYLGIYALATFTFWILWVLIVSGRVKLNPIRLVKNMGQMSIMALATTSSAITLPVAMQDSKDKLGLGDRITKLVLPLGMSLNSNGSAMHMAITVVTISQIYGIEYEVNQLIFAAVIASLVSLANAVVPGAGLVSLAIIIPQMGLPLESIALFASVEWFVGMLRTILNVNSDVFTAVLVAHSEKEINRPIFYQK